MSKNHTLPEWAVMIPQHQCKECLAIQAQTGETDYDRMSDVVFIEFKEGHFPACSRMGNNGRTYSIAYGDLLTYEKHVVAHGHGS